MNELVGYLASVLLAISLLVNNDLRFRWLNTLGCLSFIVYGMLINAFPIILTNSTLLLINLFYLVKIYNTKEDFDLLEFKHDDKLIHKLLYFYQADIKAYFPNYIHQQNERHLRFVTLRDMVIANIFVAELRDDNSAIVKINYTVPKYRDYKVGKFIFDKENKYLLSKGVKCIVYEEVSNKNHEHFIKKMGFERQAYNHRECYLKCLE
jgi:hypothetical protein